MMCLEQIIIFMLILKGLLKNNMNLHYFVIIFILAMKWVLGKYYATLLTSFRRYLM